MISGSGYEKADIMFIADGGSEEASSTGYALAGMEEKILKDLCKEVGLDYSMTWRTCLIKERINLAVPDKNRPMLANPVGIGYMKVLQNEIKEINPKILVPLSELSFQFLTDLGGIRKFRGSILPTGTNIHKPFRVLPILGPNPYLNQEYWLHFITRLDFEKLPKAIQGAGKAIAEENCWIAKTPDQLRAYLERQYKNSKFATFDIETYVGVPTCISICFDGAESVTVPILDNSLSIVDRTLMLQMVVKFLQSPLPKVNQNVKFDWKKLEKWICKVNNVSGDTLIAASCLYPEFPKNLGFLTSIYTDMPYFKDEGKQFDPTLHNRDRLYLYCAKDSLATHRIYCQQTKELKETGTAGVYNELVRVMPIYKKMEERGVRIDDDQRQRLISKYESLFEIQLLKIRKMLNEDEFNPLSSKQVRRVVFDICKYKPLRGMKTTKTGLPSTDEESLEILLWKGFSTHENGSELLRCFIAARKIHKVLEYLETPTHLDNRMRGEWNLGGTTTGRTSGGTTTDVMLRFALKARKVEAVDLGHSFQNIGKHGFEIDGTTYGKDIRSMFIPSPGYVFVEPDLSQAEARVDAVLARDFNILSVFDTPTGIHRLTGSWVFSCPPEEIKKGILVGGVDRYLTSKVTRHAGERNMREDRLMMMLHRPIKECALILKKFHDNQPNIRNVFHYEIEQAIRKTRELRAPNGRRRQFFDRYDNHMLNEAISYLPQAIVSDQLKFTFPQVYEECPWAYPLIEAHDGHLAEVPIGREVEYSKVFKRVVERPIDFRTCTLSRDFELVIPCEVEWSKENWKNMEELKW